MPVIQSDKGDPPSLESQTWHQDIMMTITPEILGEFSLQKSLIQPQAIEMTPSEEIGQDDCLSPNSLAMIKVEEGYPTQKTVQLEGACEEVDRPSYTLTDGVITLLTQHGRHFKPTRLRVVTL
ncbi:hypothetical protein AMTR_s00180p00021890 [Amborella trichopoda]|uniref:Uncharacterized protein n=1 Tax=Amborella trichopoda TaxID=13333 RepID=W1PXS6_AMBTC|nr:hypothetical protein AMTR_s00180p00021890 [Amborella trichopoda]